MNSEVQDYEYFSRLDDDSTIVVSHYEQIFWQAYLEDAYSLYTIVKAVNSSHYACGHFHPPFPAFGNRELVDYGFETDRELLKSVLRTSDSNWVGEMVDVLRREHIADVAVDPWGVERVYCIYRLPLLSPAQVAQLPLGLFRMHHDLFDSIFDFSVDLDRFGWSEGGEEESYYKRWLGCAQETFVNPNWLRNRIRRRLKRLNDAYHDRLPETVMRREAEKERERIKLARSELRGRLKDEILNRDGNICRYCGAPAEHVDHVLPLSRGGDNDPSNLAAACAPCNLSKNNKTPEEAGMVLSPIPDASETAVNPTATIANV